MKKCKNISQKIIYKLKLRDVLKMKIKKSVIILFPIIILLLIISISEIVKTVKKQQWREFNSNNQTISKDNIMTANSNNGSGISLFNEEEYREEPKKNIPENDNNEIVETEITPEEKAMYERWKKENEEYFKNGLIVEDLLNKYYEDEYKKVKEIMPNRGNGNTEITLTEFDVERAELIIKLYNEQKLTKKEKEACKQELNKIYKTPYNKVKLDDSLKIKIEKIIK